ncbi:MAG TPA: histidine kinase N-terminal 7TM domain-containing protein [Candidatus Solibacter sp.]|nr:histidine kinase N-terminal 7TM domain-containing protein [Candidatus Solibacter sp.]
MHWQYTSLVWIYLAGAGLAGWMAVYAWRRRTIPGAAAFALMQVGALLWSAGYALLASHSDLPSVLFFANVSWTGAVIEVPACLAMAMQYTGSGRLSRRAVFWQALMPAITLVVVWTSNFHGLIRHSVYLRTVGSLKFLERTPGVWFWVYFAYGYCLIVATIVILLAAVWRSPRGRRGQPGILMTGLLVSCSGPLIYNLSGLRFPVDVSSIMFIPGGLIFMLGLFRYRLFYVAPIARDTIFESMKDSAFVLDEQNRIADINSAACRLLKQTAKEIIGQSAEYLFAIQPGLVDRYRHTIEARDEIVLASQSSRTRRYQLADPRQRELHGRPPQLEVRL